MAANPASPLTAAHLAQINQGLDLVKQARNQIELAKRAGIDVSQVEDINNQNETKLRQLKQVYFPGQ